MTGTEDERRGEIKDKYENHIRQRRQRQPFKWNKINKRYCVCGHGNNNSNECEYVRCAPMQWHCNRNNTWSPVWSCSWTPHETPLSYECLSRGDNEWSTPHTQNTTRPNGAQLYCSTSTLRSTFYTSHYSCATVRTCGPSQFVVLHANCAIYAHFAHRVYSFVRWAAAAVTAVAGCLSSFRQTNEQTLAKGRSRAPHINAFRVHYRLTDCLANVRSISHPFITSHRDIILCEFAPQWRRLSDRCVHSSTAIVDQSKRIFIHSQCLLFGV